MIVEIMFRQFLVHCIVNSGKNPKLHKNTNVNSPPKDRTQPQETCLEKIISWKIFRRLHKRNLIQRQTLTNSKSKTVQVKK